MIEFLTGFGTPIAVYIIAAVIISVVMTVYDKLAAKAGWRRVPEKTLLITSALFSSVAMYATMLMIRHKTLHKKFMVGVPVIFAVKAAIIIAVAVII